MTRSPATRVDAAPSASPTATNHAIATGWAASSSLRTRVNSKSTSPITSSTRSTRNHAMIPNRRPTVVQSVRNRRPAGRMLGPSNTEISGEAPTEPGFVRCISLLSGMPCEPFAHVRLVQQPHRNRYSGGPYEPSPNRGRTPKSKECSGERLRGKRPHGDRHRNPE